MYTYVHVHLQTHVLCEVGVHCQQSDPGLSEELESCLRDQLWLSGVGAGKPPSPPAAGVHT